MSKKESPSSIFFPGRASKYAGKELISTDHLQMPRISGTVTVSLEEMDRMRSEHTQAVKVAQELESKQALVKITVEEERTTNKNIYHHGNILESYPIKEYIQKSVEYKGFDEFREIIRQEEFKKLEKQFSDMENNLNDCKKQSLDQGMLITEIKKERDTYFKQLEKITAELTETKQLLGKEIENGVNLLDRLHRVDKICTTYKIDLDALRSTKITLWYWFKTKMKNIRDLK